MKKPREIITNDFLAYFDFENLKAFREIKESPDLKGIEEKRKKKSLSKYLDSISKDSSLKEFMDNVKIDDERLVISKLIHLKYYFTKSVKTEIRQQLKECKELLKTDMCLRNTVLKEQVENEIEKLTLANKYDLVALAVNSLYDLYIFLYPEESEGEIAVRVSNTMHHLSIYRSKNKPFLTIQQASDYLDDNPEVNMYEGKEKIYYRIKDELVKDRSRFLLR